MLVWGHTVKFSSIYTAPHPGFRLRKPRGPTDRNLFCAAKEADGARCIKKEKNMNDSFMWSTLVHIGSNLWNEEGNTKGFEGNPRGVASSTLRFDKKLWHEYTEYLKEKGANTLIVDVCEAMRYDSHPELAVNGSLTKEEMRTEVERLKKMGFEVVPKLNFSSAHDIWMKDYSYMLATPKYREVCSDLIGEVCEVFCPKYFHLGMDEEDYKKQKNYDYIVIRQNDVWWKDFYHLVDCTEKNGARPWIWSDLVWTDPDNFIKKMPKDVLQSNWWYYLELDEQVSDKAKLRVGAYSLLDKHGYDQIPAGSNWAYKENFPLLVEYCKNNISGEHLCGFMQTHWMLTTEEYRDTIFNAADMLEEGKKKF